MTRPVGGPGVGPNAHVEAVLVNGPSRQSIALAKTLALFTNTASPTTRGTIWTGDRGYGGNRFQARLNSSPNGSPAGGAVQPISTPVDVMGPGWPSYPNTGYFDVDSGVGMLELGRLRNLGWS